MPIVIYNCLKCGGTGFIPRFAHYHKGSCFDCGGSGKKRVKVRKDGTPYSEKYARPTSRQMVVYEARRYEWVASRNYVEGGYLRPMRQGVTTYNVIDNYGPYHSPDAKMTWDEAEELRCAMCAAGAKIYAVA